ncbi:UDP-N-acetylglucosamine--N-acetylmuramyl-(pentapeptide) pyrophosphoryl-undecaprenol N-acetylglucosamine transferase [Oscillospiraceae bacterium WX1]
MKVLLTCGGTAGHINPALAIADELKKICPDCEILFVGSGRRLENRLIPMAGYDLDNIKISGFERSLSPRKLLFNAKALLNLIGAFGQTREIFRHFQPDIAIGTGGYVCYPVLKTASKKGIPTLIHESNAVPGLTTRLLSSKVDKVLVAFADVADLYPHPERVLFTGTPVRGDFTSQRKNEARLRLGIDGRPLVVSFWGSLGAEKMNGDIIDFIPYNIESRLFNHIHATGGSAAVTQDVKRKIREKMTGDLPRWIDIRTYIDNMPTVMAAADLVVCRGGASTLAELTLMGKPAVIVPSPNVTNNHQEKNAAQLSKAGGAVVLHERDCTGEKLYQTVKRLVSNKQQLAEMAVSMKKAGVPDSAKKIVELIISMS